ncbi:MAG TPA: carboxypeptidase regulatory-like domain-containing protein [Bryobacteraceae bacterium]|nr:carboxypeptidase regulatory-like domain-containing protein [Bryobacteraceae bacterium]
MSCARILAILLFVVGRLVASDLHGQVTFGGLPVPGATVTATREAESRTTVSDAQGAYIFAGLTDGTWTLKVDMLCFVPATQQVTLTGADTSANFELKVLPLDQVKATESTVTLPVAPPPTPTATGPQAAAAKPQSQAAGAPPPSFPQAASDDQRANDGFLINGSANNSAASPFAQSAVFGNNRNAGKGLYNGSLGVIVDNSFWDANSYSLTGQNTPKPSYNHFSGVATLGGPLKIPHFMPNGPNFFIGYQWTRNQNATTDTGLMPTLAQRNGFVGPAYPGGYLPASSISPQALALLQLYPLPNFGGSNRYNYQIPVVGDTHQDSMQARMNKAIDRRDQVFGGMAFQNTRTSSNSIFNFLDTTDSLGLAANVTWSHRFGMRAFNNLGYQFSRLATHVTPYFDNRENVSGNAGIQGNEQTPQYWGPPSLTFASGISGLSDANPSFDRNQTSGISDAWLWYHGRHTWTVGADFRRQEFNYLSQQNPRGAFTFTGAATGSDYADFLLGIPDTSSIAFGNADKYFRESVYDGYFTDDWRVSPELTINAGVRWEYGAPITELYGRLVNLDVSPGFTQVAPTVASDPVGAVTGARYPGSLLRPDKTGIEPRVAVSWRPLSGSSMVVRAGYGIYRDTSVYQNIATQMAQQPPLSKSFSVQNSAGNPLSLANGFNAFPSITPNTFAVDPNFRVGYVQIWQASIQRDLPASLQMMASYQGIKGTRGVQEFLPNTVPNGAVNPCPLCPTGFIYLTSNGDSTRESGQFQLRRRLHNGLTGSLLYVYSKSIDDDAMLGSPSRSASAQTTTNSFNPPSAPTAATSEGNALIAQNWLNLRAERSLSSFDQRHSITALLQYTTGMGAGGGILLSGWRGALFKEWTFQTQITAGTGFPETPIYLQAVQGTGVTGTIRPEYTGANVYAAVSGLYLNPSAFVAPAAGQWGNAGRNIITGPAQFTLNASLGRTFRLTDRFNLDLRVDSTNALNHVNFTSWNTIINGAQFGLPAAANAMRNLQTSLRLRF